MTKSKRFPLCWLMTVMGLLAGFHATARADTACATVTFCSGPVFWHPASGAAPVEMAVGTVFAAPGVLHTDDQARLEVGLAAGATVRLGPRTSLAFTPGACAAVPAANGPAHMILEKGSLWVHRVQTRETVPAMRFIVDGALVEMECGRCGLTLYDSGAVAVSTYAGEATVSGPYVLSPVSGRIQLPLSPEAQEAVTPWRHRVSAYRKLIVRSDGTATAPFRFPAPAEVSPWVEWNHQRDALLAPNTP